jgi:hypothetical protein
MRQLAQGILMGVLVLAAASLAGAQQMPQPMVRLGDFIEVGNDVFMHIMASVDIRYKTVENDDFEQRVRDRVSNRTPGSTDTQDLGDLSFAELRLGAEFRYQKNLTMYVLFEHQQVFDGNLIDDRSNSTNPGGTDVFGRAAGTENPGFHIERYWIDYKFAGTPLRFRVGADLWYLDPAGTVADDDPRIAVFGDFGDFDVQASAVMKQESQRLGLTNDNDFVFYMFSAGYNLKPHRFQLDVVYNRERFSGADTTLVATNGVLGFRSGLGYIGQDSDSVLVMPSWTGRFGPIRALIQGNIVAGTAHGTTTTTGLPLVNGVAVGSHKKYDIFAGAAIAYVEADLGIVRPFVGFVWGSGDGDATDNKLHGFNDFPIQNGQSFTGTSWFSHLDTSGAAGSRDYGCPARAQGLGTGTLTSLNIGPLVYSGSSAANGFSQCAHGSTSVWNERLANPSHPGIFIAYSNPGTLVIPVGVKTFPLKGHEITGWYVYRGMVKTGLLETAFAPQLAGQGIGKSMYHEFGGFYQWTVNPYFDIRLAGDLAFAGNGYKDLARLADCDSTLPGVQSCGGKNVALRGEVRFRARF